MLTVKFHVDLYLYAKAPQMRVLRLEHFKKNIGKKKLPSTKVKGYSFVLDEEFNSLKIDFSTELNFEIKDLKLFPLK